MAFFPGLDVRDLVGAGLDEGLAHAQILLRSDKALVDTAAHAGLGLHGLFQIFQRRVIELPQPCELLARVNVSALAIAHRQVHMGTCGAPSAADLADMLSPLYCVALFDQDLAEMGIGHSLAVCLGNLHHESCAACLTCLQHSAILQGAHRPAKVPAQVKPAVIARPHGHVAEQGHSGSPALAKGRGDKAVDGRPQGYGLRSIGAVGIRTLVLCSTCLGSCTAVSFGSCPALCCLTLFGITSLAAALFWCSMLAFCSSCSAWRSCVSLFLRMVCCRLLHQELVVAFLCMGRLCVFGSLCGSVRLRSQSRLGKGADADEGQGQEHK